jgi:hypothetical protein
MLLTYLAICFLAFFLSFLFGHFLFGKLILQWTKSDEISRVFFSTLLGVGTFTVLYSLFFRGVFASLFPSFLILAFVGFKGVTLHLPKLTKAWVPIVIVFSLWIIYFNFITLDTQDVMFYANLSKSLHFWKQENYFLINNIFSASFSGYTPYHYGEIWVTDAIANGISIPHVQALNHVVYPFLSFLAWLGISSLFPQTLSSWKRVTYALMVISVSFFFSMPLFSFLQTLGIKSYVFDLTEESLYKTFYFQPMAIAAAWWLRKNAAISLLWLCQIPLFSFITTPAIFGGIFIWLAVLWYQGSMERKQMLLFYGIWLGHLLALLIIQTINGHTTVPGWTSHDLLHFYQENTFYSFVTMRNILVGQSLLLLLSALPVTFLFLLCTRNNDCFSKLNTSGFLLLFFVIVSGVFSYAVFFPVKDSIQMSYVSWIGIGYLLFLSFLVPYFRISDNWTWIGLACALGCFTLRLAHAGKTEPQHSDLYVSEIKHNLNPDFIPRIGSIRITEDLNAYALSAQPISSFLSIRNFIGCIPMSQPISLRNEGPITRFRGLEVAQESAFIAFVVARHGHFWELGEEEWKEACCDFVTTAGLDGIIVETGVKLPTCLKNRAKKTISDPQSGEQLLLFK